MQLSSKERESSQTVSDLRGSLEVARQENEASGMVLAARNEKIEQVRTCRGLRGGVAEEFERSRGCGVLVAVVRIVGRVHYSLSCG